MVIIIKLYSEQTIYSILYLVDIYEYIYISHVVFLQPIEPNFQIYEILSQIHFDYDISNIIHVC